MRASELTPDIALKALLKGKVKSDKRALDVYEHASMPNNVSSDDFITLQRNGVITPVTEPMGVFKGNIALSIYNRLYSTDAANVIKARRLSKICEELVDRKVSQGYFFKLDATNPIVSTSANVTSGYSVTMLNVAWRTPVSEV